MQKRNNSITKLSIHFRSRFPLTQKRNNSITKLSIHFRSRFLLTQNLDPKYPTACIVSGETVSHSLFCSEKSGHSGGSCRFDTDFLAPMSIRVFSGYETTVCCGDNRGRGGLVQATLMNRCQASLESSSQILMNPETPVRA